MLLIFVKDAAHWGQREYRFAVCAEAEPAEDVLNLGVSPAMADAMSKPRPEPEGSGFMRAGAEEYSARRGGGWRGSFTGSGARRDAAGLPQHLCHLGTCWWRSSPKRRRAARVLLVNWLRAVTLAWRSGRKPLTSDDGLLPRDSMNTRAWP